MTKLVAPTMAEFLALDIPNRDWGDWELDGTWLSCPAYPGGDYGFDLSRFTTSAEMLDMIMQVTGKTWANDRCLAGLLRAFDDILCPQATLCGCGIDHRLTEAGIEKLCKDAK